jgi:hypothetical protein
MAGRALVALREVGGFEAIKRAFMLNVPDGLEDTPPQPTDCCAISIAPFLFDLFDLCYHHMDFGAKRLIIPAIFLKLPRIFENRRHTGFVPGGKKAPCPFRQGAFRFQVSARRRAGRGGSRGRDGYLIGMTIFVKSSLSGTPGPL